MAISPTRLPDRNETAGGEEDQEWKCKSCFFFFCEKIVFLLCVHDDQPALDLLLQKYNKKEK